MAVKSFHLIFIVDESGSMSGGPYDQVMSSVEKVINIRKALPLTKDKMSLIKFNNEAKIEILSKSVNDEFKVSPIRGGSTTFVKPLECLVEILKDIKFDVEIPIVMFLSDGEGENMQTVLDFIKRKFLNNSAIGKYCSNNENMLFFTIGYGDKADKKTLEEMAKAFNKGELVSSIGNQRLQFYYDVTNENQLIEAFTVYEKLFAFQKNILDTKRDMLVKNLDHGEQAHHRNCDLLNQLKARKEEERKQDEAKNKLAEADINAINIHYNEKIEEYNSHLQILSKAKEENSKEYKDCESELNRLERIILVNKSEYDQEKEEFEKVKKIYVDSENQNREFHVELISLYKKDENFENLIKNLKTKYSIIIEETQKNHFKNQLFNFLNDLQVLTDDSIRLKQRSASIRMKYDEVIEVCINYNSLLENFSKITNNESLKIKIWPLFVCQFYNKDIGKDKLVKTTDTEKKQILWKILYGMESTKQETKQETKKIKKKQDETDEDIYCVVQKEEENNPSEDDENEKLRLLRKAFNGIFSIISVEEFFLKNEDTPDFCDKFINTYTENIKKEIDDLIKEKTHRTNITDQKRLENEIDQKYKEKDKLNELRMEKSQILGLIKEKVKLLKENYFQARLVYDFNKLFESMKKLTQMVDALTISQQNANNN